jgi:predicted amino acid dehydrogenase
VGALYRQASLTTRVEGAECAVCGSTHNVEMHHCRMLADLKGKVSLIDLAMIARSRKQIPLCRVHHMAQHVNLKQVNRQAVRYAKSLQDTVEKAD